MSLPDPTYHTLDWQPPGFTGRRTRRRIGVFVNHRNPVGAWVTPAFDGSGSPIIVPPGIAKNAGPPQGWVGKSTYLDSIVNAPLRFCARSTADVNNPHAWSASTDSTPDIWVEWTPLGVTPGVSVATSEGGQTTFAENVWPWVDVRLTHANNFIKEDIIIKSPSSPSSFDFNLEVGAPGTWELSDSVVTVRDALGGVVLKTRPVYGTDANGTYIRCTLTQIGTWGPGGKFPTLRLTPNPDDMADAVYPVTVDPTTTIPETSLDDTYLNGVSAVQTWNFGATTQLTIRTSLGSKGLIRCDATLVPAGTITTVRLYLTIALTAANVSFYKVTAANAGWVEGTGTGSGPQTGSTCWTYLAYDASTPTAWAGGPGMDVSGTDFVADASPPSLIGDPLSGKQTIDLLSQGVSWMTDWRDTPANNGGLTIRRGDGDAFSYFYATEDSTAANRPYFEVDYNLPSGQPALIRHTPTHIAGKGGFLRGKF